MPRHTDSIKARKTCPLPLWFGCFIPRLYRLNFTEAQKGAAGDGGRGRAGESGTGRGALYTLAAKPLTTRPERDGELFLPPQLLPLVNRFRLFLPKVAHKTMFSILYLHRQGVGV